MTAAPKTARTAADAREHRRAVAAAMTAELMAALHAVPPPVGGDADWRAAMALAAVNRLVRDAIRTVEAIQ